MSKKTFRPPRAVLEAVAHGWKHGDGKAADIKILKGQPLSLGEVQGMYRYLSDHLGDYQPVEKSETLSDSSVQWLLHGGAAGLRWSRRILRQEGIMKSSSSGNTLIPEVVDLQLGPHILAGVVQQECDQVMAALEKAGVSSSCFPIDSGTLVFLSKDHKLAVNNQPTSFPITQVDLSKIGLLDESGSRLRSIIKYAGTNQSNFTCFSVTDPVEAVPGVILNEAYLLKAEDEIVFDAQVIKVDTELGLVLGWAIISMINGEPYFDKQGDYIPEDSMLEAACDFMQHYRVGKDLHSGGPAGTVVFAWPLTTEVAKAFNIETKQTGLMIAMRPDPELLEKFRTGEYKGFSIGGTRIPEHTEEVE